MPVYKPVINGDYIIYESQIDGVENLVAIHRKDKREFQVTSRKFGASNLSPTPNGRLLFNDYFVISFAYALHIIIMPAQGPRVALCRKNGTILPAPSPCPGPWALGPSN